MGPRRQHCLEERQRRTGDQAVDGFDLLHQGLSEALVPEV